MKITIFPFFVIASCHICFAQDPKESKGQNWQILSIEKRVPVYIGPYILNKCSVSDLLILLQDSLSNEGYTNYR
jgi:hypothetical protein